MSEFEITYDQQTYIVPLTGTSTDFYVKSTSGQPIQVSADVATHLFGAAQAVLMMQRVYADGGFSSLTSSWVNFENSVDKILALQSWLSDFGALGALGSAASVDLLAFGAADAAADAAAAATVDPAAATVAAEAAAAAATAAAAADISAADAVFSAVQGAAVASVDFASSYALVLAAKDSLSRTTDQFNEFFAPGSTGPVSYSQIVTTANATLAGVLLGNTATQAASQIPGVSLSGSPLYDAVGFLTAVLSPLAAALTAGTIPFEGLPTTGVELLADATSLASGIDTLNATLNQLSFAGQVASILNGIVELAAYGPLTDSGRQQSVAGLQAAGVIGDDVNSLYAVTPSQSSVDEKGGNTITFTITRSNGSQKQTVYVSTLANSYNNSSNYYYNGLPGFPVTFAANITSAPVTVTINDEGLTAGSETFGLIVQSSANDPVTQYLASTRFTINNDDPLPKVNYTISPTAPSIAENAGVYTFTITRDDTSSASTVYVSTVHDLLIDNTNGNQYYEGIVDQPVIFAAGRATAQVQLTINDLRLLSGSETFRLIVQQYASDPIDSPLTSTDFTIVNSDLPATTPGSPEIITGAQANEATNTLVPLQPFVALTSAPTGASVSLVNFINTDRGPGQLAVDGIPVTGNIAIAYADIDQVGFLTGSVAGADEIEISAMYSDGSTSNINDLTINAEASAPPPSLPKNSSGPVIGTNTQPFQVTVGQSGVLSASYLSASDAAYPDPSLVTYNVTGYPNEGFIFDNGQLVHSFTQADINAGSVTYHAEMQANLTSQATDSLTYVVSDPSFRTSSVTTVSLRINPLPAPSTEGEPYLDTIVFPTVDEGAQIFVLSSDLHVTDANPNIPPNYAGTPTNVAIKYTIVQGPSHGTLEWVEPYPSLYLGGPSWYGLPVTAFTQNDVNNGWFIYKNDFTSGAADSFSFTVSDGFGGTIGPTTVSIPIQPVNPLLLRMDAGIFVTSGGQSKISADWLQIQDSAPNATYPVITVTHAPSYGSLLVSGQSAASFTQLDIDRGLVTYQQADAEASSDQFTLSVVDQYGNTLPSIVVPVTIGTSAVDLNTGATVDIGQSVTIDGANLSVSDPGLGSGDLYADPSSVISYIITALPEHGALSIGGSTLQVGGEFTQEQLHQNLLTYTEDGSIAGTDSFAFSVTDIVANNSFGSGVFKITITGADGSNILTGSTVSQILYSGPGNNLIVGSGDATTLSYSAAPSGVSVDLATSIASNGFGGTDTITGINTVIGSAFDDVLVGGSPGPTPNGSVTSADEIPAGQTFYGGGGNNTIIGGSGVNTAGYADPLADYEVVYNDGGLTVTGPNNLDTLTNIQTLQFTDMALTTLNSEGDTATAQFDDATGTGHIYIQSGTTIAAGLGSAFAPNGLDLGGQTGGEGDAAVTGTGALLSNIGPFLIGGVGFGSLLIQNGGTVTASLGTGQTGNAAEIASQVGSDGSSVNVSGANSNWQITGSLLVGNAGAGSLNITAGGTITATALDLGSQSDSSGIVTVSGDNSTLVTTGSLAVGDAGAGELSILNGAQVTIGGDLDIGLAGGSGNIDIDGIAGTVTIGANINVGSGAAVLTIGPNSTLTQDNGGVIAGSNFVENVYGNVDPVFSGGGSVNVESTKTIDYTAYVKNTTFNVTPGTAFTLQTPVVYGASSLNIGQTGDSTGAELILNAGSFGSGSSVTFNDPMSTLVIGIDQLATIDVPASGTGPFMAEANPDQGHLLISEFDGTIKNFQAGDTIDVDTYLSSASAGTLSVNGSVVSVIEISNGDTLGFLTFDSAANAAAAVADKAIQLVPCFAAGTRIATVRGEVAVEAIGVGDLVRVLLGGEPAGDGPMDDRWAAVIWVGRREVECTGHPTPKKVWPVRLAAGAFGPGRPHSDVWLSPDHAVYVGEVLIPVRYLVNGTSIAQVPVERVTYHHLELAEHNVLLAEGLPAESFLDMRDGSNYSNRPGPVRLYPDYSARMWEAFGCARLIVTGTELVAARALVAGAAAALADMPGSSTLTPSGPPAPCTAAGQGHLMENRQARARRYMLG